MHKTENPRNRKYFYIVRTDRGFAPNPFHKLCTLATCKPKIRKSAKEGDWIIGFYSRAKNIPPDYCGKLVYAMKVTEKIEFNEYWKDKRFSKKKPSSKNSESRCGDNIYHQNSEGKWIQAKNPFHSKGDIEADTAGKFVLISNHFFYFGKEPVQWPEDLERELKSRLLRRGHQYRDLEKSAEKIINFLEKNHQKKRYGIPIDYESSEKKCHRKNACTRKPLKPKILKLYPSSRKKACA